jgi:methionine-rich copper-binding protein CopC
MLWLRVIDGCGGLRVATALAAAGAGLIFGSAGTAFADSGAEVVGVSPARGVVQFAPYAVSVTFSTELRGSGASMSIRSTTGEVGVGQVSTGARTLRRSVVEGAPNGAYTVDWSAVAENGDELSGSFRFTAGHPNNDPLLTGEPVPEATASSPAAPPQPSPPVRDPWRNDGDVIAAPVPDHPDPPSNDGAPYRFPLIALGLGGLLVIASGLVSRRHKPAGPQRLTIQTRNGVYSV